jgi:hypothetical protein
LKILLSRHQLQTVFFDYYFSLLLFILNPHAAQRLGYAQCGCCAHRPFRPAVAKSFGFVFSFIRPKQNPEDFAVPLDTPRPMGSALKPALSIAIVGNWLFRPASFLLAYSVSLILKGFCLVSKT